MKQCICVLLLVFTATQLNAQSILDRLKQRAKDKANQKIEQRVDQKMDKEMDNVLDAPKKGKSKTSESDSQPETTNRGSSSSSKKNAFTSYSKFDFVPGQKIVAAEDFSQDAVGDFPDKWNTNGSGEIVTLSGQTGKFLMTQKEVVFYPEWIKDLPDNFTLEFDLICNPNFNYYSGYFNVGFTTSRNIGKDFRSFARFGIGKIANGGGFEVALHPTNAGNSQGLTHFISTFNMEEIVKNEADQNQFHGIGNSSVHVSIWRQKNRVRVYLNDKKVWDLPKGCPDDLKLNSIYFRNNAANNDVDFYYLGNVKLAVGAPDTRNKLITEGKFVTNGILFDVNSDKIKPESYGAIKDIATVLEENSTVKVKIIGHTDADGDDASNLALSKKRAEAVKAILSSTFKIDASRLSIDGKGESQPVDKSNTSVGKANNRRVEFIKE
jgi:OmpA-OmpF porin, OOP family